MITIQELLYTRGLPRDARVKLVRHKDSRYDLLNLYRTNSPIFFEYQNCQRNDVFRDCEYIATFIGEEDSKARFVGVFRVLGRKVKEGRFIYGDMEFSHIFKYKMEELPGFEDLKERVIVRWSNPISWHQWIANDMEVIDFSPGLSYRQFTDYNDIILSFRELREIVNNKYKEWKTTLSSVKGIYLITDKATGFLYVGSAYGENGVWGRWSNYVASNGGGGNKALESLIASDADYADKNFQFSILTILPNSITPDEVIRKEQMYKRKLGSRAFGLNNN